MTFRKGMIQSGIRLSKLQAMNAGSTVAKVRRSSNGYSSLSSDYEQISPNGKPPAYADPTASVTSLEVEGIPSKHAEAISSVMNEVFNLGLTNMSESLISDPKMRNILMVQEANLLKLKSQVRHSQLDLFYTLHSDVGKLRSDIRKMRGELSCEMDKVIAKQRDLDLEGRRIHDKLANQSIEITNLINNLDLEVHAMKANMATSKYDVFKYCVGTFISTVVGIGLIGMFGN